MAHFDVHATTDRNARGTPYVVVVQSSRFDQRPSRVVIPLAVLNASRGLDNETGTAVQEASTLTRWVS
jgi:hypothetical protein